MKNTISRFFIALIAAVALSASAMCVNAAQGTAESESYADTYYARLESCRDQIEQLTDFKPDIVLVLGTGLGDYVNSLDVKLTVSYKDIEGWPVSTAPEHAGNLVFAEYNGLKLAVMQGRVHYYEGYSMDEVVLPLRVLHMLGADTAILTNAVGSLNPDFKIGDFVCVKDQITAFIPSPLIGENIDELGERFVSMTETFDKDMQDTILKAGEENGIPVHSGVYLQTTGPQYETPAEANMYRSLGADTISMSLGAEAVAASHMKMKVCAINCVSAMGAGMEEEGFSQDTVEENMENTLPNFRTLMNGLLDSLTRCQAEQTETEEPAQARPDYQAAQTGTEEPGEHALKDGTIGIISAMDNEIALLLKNMEGMQEERYAGRSYYTGELCGHQVVVVKAGIGKVRAATGAAALLDHFDLSGVIFTGIAGGVGDETQVLDVVIATDLVQHDYGQETNDGFVWTGGSWGDTGYYYCDPELIRMAYESAVKIVGEDHTFMGTIATGDQFVASEKRVNELNDEFGALACEMEGAAVASVCEEYDKPYVVIRTMSDKADGKAISTYLFMRDDAADHSCEIVMDMLNGLS